MDPALTAPAQAGFHHRALHVFAVGHFSHPALQLHLVAQGLEAAGAIVRRCTSRRNKFAKTADVILQSLAVTRTCDVVITQGHGGPNIFQTLITAFLCRVFNKPMILIYCGGELAALVKRHTWAYHYVFASASSIVVASRYLGDMIEGLGYPTTEIPHVVIRKAWTTKRRPCARARFIAVRGMHKVYNPLMVLRAFRRIRDRVPASTLTYVGEGVMEEQVRAYSDAHNLNVRFRSRLTHVELDAEMAAHDVFLNASNADNQPVSLIEAMTCGLPIVSTNVGGIPFMRDIERAALLVAPDDDGAMADCALRVVGSPALAASLSASGPEVSARYDWDAMRDDWVSLVRATVKKAV